MKIIVLTGSHPRHLYMVNQLSNKGMLAGHIMEVREEFIPQPPSHLIKVDKDNFIRHFKDRAEAESRFFHAHDKIKHQAPLLPVTKETLNSSETIKWLKNIKADLAISYGVHKLDDELLNSLPNHAWNIHGGLSPWFRGNVTLFWPFYMLRPNWAGMTIHRLTDKLDGGAIVHHSVPTLEYGDGVHDVACKAVCKVVDDLQAILNEKKLEEIHYFPQKSSGKLFIGSDWTPQQLRLIYQTFHNDIVDHFLDGKLEKIEPPLVNQLKLDDKL